VKPLIAAVEGFAVAGGLEIALACDLLVAARGAKLGVPEVKRGLLAAGGALKRLPQRLPYGLAMELALTGEPIMAERAYELRLVNRLAEPGGALAAAFELADLIAANGPPALAATKEGVGARAVVASRRLLRLTRPSSWTRSWPPRTRVRARARSPRNARPPGKGDKRDPVGTRAQRRPPDTHCVEINILSG